MSIENTLQQQNKKLIKVVLFGPESTGKTTLSRQLAAHYNTLWAPEFLREFAQNKWDNEQKACEPSDIIHIAQGQMRLENEASQRANQILICDTNLLETKVYAETYFENFALPELNHAIASNHYDLYCLTYIDTPWEADDLRDRPELRAHMFTQFEKALIKHNKNYLLLKGDKATRLSQAIAYIDSLLK